jgi:hypothetical protein
MTTSSHCGAHTESEIGLRMNGHLEHSGDAAKRESGAKKWAET